MKNELKTIEGIVETIVYRNDENDYTVLDLDNKSELVTVVGILPTINEGDEITVMGDFTSHRSFGVQFKASSWTVKVPEGSVAIKNYLASGGIKGIGPVLARRIIDKFAEKTLDIIEHNPELLSTVKGISKSKAKLISEDFSKMFGMRNVIMFLSKYNFPANFAVRAWNEHSSATIELIKQDPFILCERNIRLNFNDADKIRLDLGIADDADVRLCAAIKATLTEELSSGHACLPMDELSRISKQKIMMSQEKFESNLEVLLYHEEIFIRKVESINYVYIYDVYETENYIATRISMYLNNKNPSGIAGIEKIINAHEDKNGIKYAHLQRKAIKEAISNPVMILTGGPGTGKTTTLKAIISIFKDLGKNVNISAPTGRAAKRISELTGYEAKTIHRLLGVNMQTEDRTFIHNENNPLKCDVLVIDELSMVDMILFKDLLKALNFNCQIIMVGDSDQLPPVGVGNILKDFINSGVIPYIELKEIFRQALESDIVKNAHKIISGEVFDVTKKNGDFFYISKNNEKDITELVSDLLIERLPNAYDFSPLWDIQILCPTRIGGVGTQELNRVIQDRINPSQGAKSEIKYNGNFYRVGDKVMQIKNNYDVVWKDKMHNIEETGVFNGDIGEIVLIDKMAGIFQIAYDEKIAVYQTSQINEIELAYAITVHKSQGSEFESVIMPISPYMGRMAYRNLLYTAVTRAKRMMVLVGSYSSIDRMVSNVDKTFKYTNLSELLKNTKND